MTEPVTVGDLLTIGVDRIRRPATVADLVSALRAEGVLVVEKVDGVEEMIAELKRRGYMLSASLREILFWSAHPGPSEHP